MPNLNKLSILIVDDQKAVRDSIIAAIAGSEFTYWEARTWTDAIELAKRTRDIAIDLLVVDALMPPFNGMNLAKKVRDFRPGVKALFINQPLEAAELLGKLRALVHASEHSLQQAVEA